MSWYNDCKLENDNGEYYVVIYLNPNATEFSSEFFSDIKKNVLGLDEQVKNLIAEKFPNIKISCAKIIIGSVMLASIPFVSIASVEASDTSSITQTYYITKLSTTAIVTASKLNVRSGPGTSYSIIHALWYGNKIKVIGKSGSWVEIMLSDGRIGWVSNLYVSLAEEPTIAQQKIDLVLNTAFSLIGMPYVWGGSTPSDGGFDCSGFTQYVFGKAGYILPRISKDQAAEGTQVYMNNIQPGDLIIFSIDQNGLVSHVGIYIGDGKMIHSPKTGDTVKVTDITTSYWQSRIISVRRIIQ
ncbi:MAG: C40 family peptidase [Solirubrobacterales bacterium]